MFRAQRFTALRLARAMAVGVPLSVGCTSILGIDGNYTDELAGAGGKTHPRADASGDGGEGGTGGAENSGAGGNGNGNGDGGSGAQAGTGGTRGDGGAVSNTDASLPLGAGGAAVDPGCRPGKYAGTIKGLHSPSFTVVAVPLAVSGPLVFELTGAGGMLQIAPGSGKINAKLAGFPPGGPDALEASVDGSYDCATHQVTGHLLGKVNAGITSIEGTLTGDLMSTAAKDAARSWEEHEGTSTAYKGSGTWYAKWTGP